MSSKEREEVSVGGVGEALEDEDIRAKRGERGLSLIHISEPTRQAARRLEMRKWCWHFFLWREAS